MEAFPVLQGVEVRYDRKERGERADDRKEVRGPIRQRLEGAVPRKE